MVVVENEEEEVVIEEEAPDEREKEELPAPAPEKRKEPTTDVYVPPVPFPQRLAHAIKEMPSYAKFLKKVLSNKRQLLEIGVETLRGECNAILECKVPKKEADPGCFTIPVKFGEVLVNKALADLGASVSIMPLSLCKRINAKIKPTRMSLQLADRLVRFPIGVVEDLPVQIGMFYVPCDFVIMDIVEDHVIPIILGRDFLKTARAVFDVFNGKVTLNILGEDVEFPLPSIMKGPVD
ncbi:DNA damage-inducible protein 1-like [Amaranthus tricolor]|uniref:DNA damage-inducible protein 1-like n=1 Tax=Amaranthus tricolor TaxID=29722 RepID=UPI00258C7EB3|nr:DNA damage-inducible protein 1-like [Amaranthus tricolor]